MTFRSLIVIFLFTIGCKAGFTYEAESLLADLELIQKIDYKLQESLPIVYNQTQIVGYINMPSARMAEEGMISLSAAHTPPYMIYSLGFQPFKQIEVSGNYRVFKDCKELNFGDWGFGDDADRTANVKFSFLAPQDGFSFLPNLAVGFDDFFGSRRFYSAYIVATQQLRDYGLELTIGWGKGRIRHAFGGIAWSPWWPFQTPFLKDITFISEYDAIDYKNHEDEHPEGRSIKSRLNFGVAATFFNAIQLKVGSIRGEKIGAQASVFYNFGTTKGLFPKDQDPPLYQSPVNYEAIGKFRTERALAKQLAFAFAEQGFNLVSVYITHDENQQKNLWLKIINLRYWRNSNVKERIEYILSHLMPDNIVKTTIIIEESGFPVESYCYRTKELKRFREGKIGENELYLLCPTKEAPKEPTKYEALPIFYRKKSPWAFSFAPRVITFFGSTTGKLKYTAGLTGTLTGYLKDSVYYKMQLAYNAFSSASDVGDKDVYNPSQLLNVRSDMVRYYRDSAVSLEQAYIQKGWNIGSGVFFRLATGYFEIAYGGIAGETLYYPVNSNWAIGVEGAVVWKRSFNGLGFQSKIRKLNGFTPEFVPFTGLQGFLNYFYDFKPFSVDLKLKLGQFLAKDRGVRVELSRYYQSGLRFSVWMTFTNGKDVVNGKRYFDKGISFQLPFDIFLRKSSRSVVGYAMSAWLRDVGAIAANGKNLYPTIHTARIY